MVQQEIFKITDFKNKLKKITKDKNALKKYFNIVLKSSLNQNSEFHHILPRSIFNKYSKHKQNLVKLSYEEHFLAHYWFAKATGYLWNAVFYMLNNPNKKNIKEELLNKYAKEYTEAKEKWKIIQIENSKGEKNPHYGKKHTEKTKKIIGGKTKEWIKKNGNPFLGKKHTQETKDKLSKIHKNKKRNKEQCEKISKALKGKPKTEEHKKKIGEKHKGKILSQETKDKIREYRKNKNWEQIFGKEKAKELKEKKKNDILTCPHCGKTCNRANAIRWHFDNCKQKTGKNRTWESLYGKSKAEELKKKKSQETLICPHCNKECNKLNAIRWHFDNCKYLSKGG